MALEEGFSAAITAMIRGYWVNRGKEWGGKGGFAGRLRKTLGNKRTKIELSFLKEGHWKRMAMEQDKQVHTGQRCGGGGSGGLGLGTIHPYQWANS